MKRWIEDSWWSWRNCIGFRLDYKDNIDRLALFEELNCGWYQMYIYPYDDAYNPTISPERKLRLAQEPYVMFLPKEDYDFMVKMIENPEPYTTGFGMGVETTLTEIYGKLR